MASDPQPAADAPRDSDAQPAADPPQGSDAQQAADARLAEALTATGAEDPRGSCRALLRELKQISPDGYAEGLGYYQKTLVPSIAGGDADPLEAWRDYGLLLARLTPGRAVAVDATGRSRPFAPPGDPADLVLHLPERSRNRPILVAPPASPTPAQDATHRWLVMGQRTLEGQ